ncbi:MAG: hypothetical protein ACEPOZ_12035 [Marinifilaceae bacterium]
MKKVNKEIKPIGTSVMFQMNPVATPLGRLAKPAQKVLPQRKHHP